MNRLKYILPLAVVALLGSCAKEQLPDTPAGVGKDEVRINYSLPVATVVETRADMDKEAAENTISSMHVLVFTETAGVADKFVEMQKATLSTGGSAIVKLADSEGAKRVVRIVANADKILEGKNFTTATTWDEVAAALTLGTATADAPPKTPLPMFSQAIALTDIKPGATSIGDPTNPAPLKSSYAKVTIGSDGTQLVISSYALRNAPSVGGSIFGTPLPDPTPGTKVTYKLGDTPVANYLFPVKASAADKIELIVKGRFDGETVDTYYRIELSKPKADGTREYFNIQPNYYYKVKLTSVGTHGYPNESDAIANPPSNVEYTIEIGDGVTGPVVSNGQYYMSLSRTTYEIPPTAGSVEIATIRTDATASAKRSAQIISSLGEGGDFIKDVAVTADGKITATTSNIEGGAVVRVAVGNIYQDITITNYDAPITMVDTDEEAYIKLPVASGIAATLSTTELNDRLDVTITSDKLTVSRKNIIFDGQKYVGTINVTNTTAGTSYNIPLTLEMQSVNVGGTEKLSATRKYKAGGVNWAMGNLVASNSTATGAAPGTGAKIGARTDGGLYFQFGSLIGWKGGNPSNGGTGVGIPTVLGDYESTWNGSNTYSWSNQSMLWPAAFTSPPTDYPNSKADNEYYFGLNTAPYDQQGTDISIFNGFSTGALATATTTVGDPCRYYLGDNWRTPTVTELKALFNNKVGYIPGIKAFKSNNFIASSGNGNSAEVGRGIYANTNTSLDADALKDPNAIFFPAQGFLDWAAPGKIAYVGYGGYASTSSTFNGGGYYYLAFECGNAKSRPELLVPEYTGSRSYALPVRCVKDNTR